MHSKQRPFAGLGLGLLWALTAGLPAMAEDVELFVATSNASFGSRPNILFVIDDSGSMGTEVLTQANYDPNVTYDGSCSASRVYWRTSQGDPPDCETNRWFERSSLTCAAALDAFAQSGGGIFIDRAAQFDPTTGRGGSRWEAISSSQHTRLVECQDDEGVHGNGVDLTRLYPQNGSSSQPWAASRGNGGFRWGSNPASTTYTLFDGNYLNWYYGPTGIRTRLEVVQDVATGLLGVISDVNIGIMNFNREEGGSVIYAMENIETGRASMQSTINALTPNGFTPLSETLYEATQYWRGGAVDYGSTTSVAASRDPGNPGIYQSPLELSCQKNFVVLLTDGEPTRDHSADSKILSLPSYGSLVGGCDAESYPAGFSPDGGDCLDDLAEYLYEADLSDLPGQQNVTTYTIGFTIDLPILADAAARGGGEYYTADDTATLSTALTNIVTSILDTATTFVSPAVSVNSFNRTQNLNEVYISVFQPSGQAHWPGNLKKYRLRPGDATLIDVNGAPAVDPATGFFTDTSRSFWSTGVDGSRVTAGGAANQIPAPNSRRVYTYIGSPALTDPTNRVATGNAAINDALLNTGVAGDPTRDDVIDFINGWDMGDQDQDNNTNEARNQMGDPLHTQPISVIYGPGNEVATLYFATNDGYLHAIDPETGAEKWAFIPAEFLGNQIEFYKNESTAAKMYGIDGSLRVQTLANQDGVIDAAGGEKVYLYFGMRRGGDFYYALDVTDPDQPAVLWRLDSGDLPGIGQSWAAPVPVRVNIDGATQNANKLAIVIGGGYDPTQDSPPANTDSIGNSLYIVDSASGNLLWHGSNTGATQNFAAANGAMVYSIPSEPKVIDLNSDGFADRMYVADMGGQVWRFDIRNGNPAGSLVTGGVFAQLGAAGLASPTLADTRRFYYSPDVAIVSSDDLNFVHVGVGSGYRAHPNSTDHQDRFYALRDYNAFTALNQSDYDTATPIVDADLVDVTEEIEADVPYGEPGWRFELRDGGWRGEKVLAEARTFNNEVYFTTFTPTSGVSTGCEPRLGTNRLYVMSLFNGAPVTNLDGSIDEETLTEEDRYQEFQGSITSEVVFIFPSPDDPANCVGDECTPAPVAFVGLFGFLPPFLNNPVRTFWSEETTQ